MKVRGVLDLMSKLSPETAMVILDQVVRFVTWMTMVAIESTAIRF